MGSCKSIALIHSKSTTQAPINLKYPSSKINLVSIKDVEFLKLLFKELCIRNNSKKLLEKSIFLGFIPVPGVLGERLFDMLDNDSDGYIDEDQFFWAMEKYSKNDNDGICDEIFKLCDLKNDQCIDKEEFSITFNSLIQEVAASLQGITKCNGQDTSQGSFLSQNKSIKLNPFSSSASTLGSANETILKAKEVSEAFVNTIYEKFSSNGKHLTVDEFCSFFTSQQWLIPRIKHCFRCDVWKSEAAMRLKTPRARCLVSQPPSGKSNRVSVKVFIHGKWLKRYLEIKQYFLLLHTEKNTLEDVIFLENCITKEKDCNLSLIYSSQYDERITFSFPSALMRQQYSEAIHVAGGMRKFKDFFKLEERIGHGKFSEVYVAQEIVTGEKFAAKLINKRMLDQEEREMIRKEISILNNFNHPGIIKIKDIFDSHKNIIIVMELVKGGELLKKIRGENANENVIKNIIKQILIALSHLHKLGVMHRDLKPENILVYEDNGETFIKIIDFGLSTYVLPDEFKDFRCGTLGYTAPEVFAGKYSLKADLWSVGVITYAYLTGKLPFFSYSKEELMEITQTKEVSFNEALWTKYSKSAQDFVQSLLNKNPINRPSCDEALSHNWLLCNL